MILIFAKKMHLMNPVSLGLDQRISSLLHWRGFAKPVWSHVKLFGERSPKSDKSTLIFHSSSKFTQLLEVIRPAQKYRIARAHWFVGSNVHLAGITSATSKASCAPLRTQVSKICFFQNQLCVESWWEKIIESRGYNGSYWSGVFVLWGKAGITLKSHPASQWLPAPTKKSQHAVSPMQLPSHFQAVGI